MTDTARGTAAAAPAPGVRFGGAVLVWRARRRRRRRLRPGARPGVGDDDPLVLLDDAAFQGVDDDGRAACWRSASCSAGCGCSASCRSARRRRGSGPAHRIAGSLALLVSLPVAYHCLWSLGFNPDPGGSRRFWHSVLGCAFYGAFATKVLVVRSRRMPGWALPVVGGLLFTVLVLIWLTSSCVVLPRRSACER